MSDIPEQLQGVVADTAEAVSDQAEAFANATRSLTQAKIQFTTIGYLMGAATGAVIAWRLAYRRAERLYSRIADDEVEAMSEHYHAKVRGLEATQKGDLEDLVAERGYGTEPTDEKPPMAVSPPDQVVEAATDSSSAETTRVPPPVPVDPAPKVSNIFRDAPDNAAIMDSWNYAEERRKRSPDIPYVIHYDERHEFEDYDEMTLTYYEKDDVLANERDEVIGEGQERDALIGEGNLDRFGHGSNDPNVVYIRNDRLEIIIEVCRSIQAYAQEVHGFEHTGYSSNLERMRQREHDEPDDDR